jgi:hypothetical protein
MKEVIASLFLALVLCISALGQTSELKTTGTDLAHQCADRQSPSNKSRELLQTIWMHILKNGKGLRQFW